MIIDAITIYFCIFILGQLQQSSWQIGRWYDRSRRETSEHDLSIDTRVLIDHRSCNHVVVIDYERRLCCRLRYKKRFDHGFHRGILVRGCNCDRGNNRRLQEKITNGSIIICVQT